MSGVLKGVAGDSVVGLGANVRRQSEMISVAEGRRPGCHDIAAGKLPVAKT